jgi:hypothetical protein
MHELRLTKVGAFYEVKNFWNNFDLFYFASISKYLTGVVDSISYSKAGILGSILLMGNFLLSSLDFCSRGSLFDSFYLWANTVLFPCACVAIDFVMHYLLTFFS